MADRLSSVARRLRFGESRLEEVLAGVEDRFERIEPELLSFVAEEGRFERLRLAATELAATWPEAGARPPLYGVAVGIKDIFHVDGLETRAGSQLPPNELVGPQGEAVERLRAAGALILGKTATTEFAYFAPAATRTPRAPGHTPGGSSSGSAAAVSAGLVPLALGTQTIGSISRPAAFCGVVGFKPTYGRISTAGVIPLAPSLDHVGLFAGGVEDAELAAAVLCRDWRPGSEGAARRLGVPIGPYLERVDAPARARFSATCRLLGENGFDLVPLEVMGRFDDIDRRHGLILAAEAAQVHGRWYAPYRALYNSKTAELIDRGLTVPPDELSLALEERESLIRELEVPLLEETIDLWISPAAVGGPPAGLDSTGDPVMSMPWSQAGLPTVTIPAGSDAEGLPLGLQLAARRGGDELLLSGATAIEEVLEREAAKVGSGGGR